MNVRPTNAIEKKSLFHGLADVVPPKVIPNQITLHRQAECPSFLSTQTRRREREMEREERERERSIRIVGPN